MHMQDLTPDMGAVYILLGCLALSGLVIIGILIYCTSHCWRKRCFKSKGQSGGRRRPAANQKLLNSSDQAQELKHTRMNGLKSYSPGKEKLLDPQDDIQAADLTPYLHNYNTDFSSLFKKKSNFWQLHNNASEMSKAGGAADQLNTAVPGGPDDVNSINSMIVHYDMGYEKCNNACFRGTLTFALRYDYIHRVLMLHLIRASHLPPKDRYGTVDPYIKMYLLPDRRNHCKTRIHRKTLNPEFNEMFSFVAGYGSLSSRMLQFTVYDFDRFSRHDLIGNVIMRDLFEKSDLYTWTEYTMHIIASNEKDDYGDLLLFLCYQQSDEKMTITVVKAYNLRPMDITGASDPYVKMYQLMGKRRLKTKKTSIKRANLNPVYNEALVFDILQDQLDQTNILVKVMDWDRIGSDDLLGCAVLGSESPTPEGRSQWLDAIAHPGRPVGKWHSLLAEVPNQFTNLTKSGTKV